MVPPQGGDIARVRVDPVAVRRDWVMNANDSYWLPNPAQKLEGYARIIGCEKCQRTLRTRMVDHYVIDALKKGKISRPRSAASSTRTGCSGAS